MFQYLFIYLTVSLGRRILKPKEYLMLLFYDACWSSSGKLMFANYWMVEENMLYYLATSFVWINFMLLLMSSKYCSTIGKWCASSRSYEIVYDAASLDCCLSFSSCFFSLYHRILAVQTCIRLISSSFYYFSFSSFSTIINWLFIDSLFFIVSEL